MQMNEKTCIIHELYETLEKLQYPEVAQTRFEEFENTILAGNKRLDLLNWLLQESPGFNISSLNKLKENTLEEKLFKCFSQIGLCSDLKVLSGKCPIEEQLQFLSLLTLFVKNIHLADIQSAKEDKQLANNFLKEDIESTKIDSISNSNIESSKLLIDEQLCDKYALDKLCSDVKANIQEISEKKPDIYDPVLQKFNTSFKNISSLETQNGHSNIFSECYKDISTDIQNIHSAFTIFNKTLINEGKIKNRSELKNSTKTIKPLTQAIKENLVLIEQAHNMFDNKAYH